MSENTTPAGAVEQVGMAERHATVVADASVYRRGTDNYARVWQGARAGALAAIIETTEAAAKLAEDWKLDGPYIARAIRHDRHLKGPKP